MPVQNLIPLPPLPYGGTRPGQPPTPTGLGSSSPLPGYNINPTPTGGQGAYGLVPGNIDIPPSTWQQVGSVAPGLQNTSQLTNNIMSELQGDINPQALKNMQDAAASYGVSSGMPGSNAIPGTLAFNKNLRNIGLDTMAIQRQGQQDYLSALQGIGGTQTPQGLAAEIAAHNAQMRAAPDPQAAAQQQLANYWAALNALRGPGGGTGGQLGAPSSGTGALAPQVPFAGGTPSPGVPSPAYGGQSYYAGLNPADSNAIDQFWDQGQNLPSLGSTLGQQSPIYDQSTQPDLSGYEQAYANPEDYYAGILAGG